ncbi:type VI secretion system baseplate subunit TssG [Serratia sp. UGAL515B_01]|uniref:type VI secretion system baseplate subunit TssG n=1 Tax=Serratia sp. UGAL515B_01 TaxID=2986763 RepID=UPI0029549DDD|nr:type VI secretion system baseplate subunit TssG [Serratia sp. UGAL515B_01]WON77458.1 type VI secretion system baseplate subunit TssG [Serratia sp. UGAL515B_01]
MSSMPALIVGLSASQDFFELLRRIERATPHEPRLGSSGVGRQRRLKIIQPADMAFAPREVADVRQRLNDQGTGSQVVIYCRHFGLFAPYGPLPIHITEHARNESLAKRNQAFQDFASILSQRMAILHYRSWAQLNVAVGHDRITDNPFLRHICQIAGVHPQQQLNPHIARIRSLFPGAYLPGRGSLRKLQEILTHYFSIAIRLEPHKGLWIDDPKHGQNQRMGKLGTTRLGKRFFDVQHCLVVNIGPVSEPDYHDYQRGSERLQTLIHICHDFVRHRMVLDVNLIIQTSPEMACRLGKGSLSRQSWLKPGSALHVRHLYRTVN